jgi:hypothetical protein
MVNTELLEEVHVPPGLPFVVKIVVAFSQSDVSPDSTPAFGPDKTVTEIVATSFPEQPDKVVVYEMTTVPALTPVTTPEALTVAIAGFEEDQVPPVDPFEEIVVVFP